MGYLSNPHGYNGTPKRSNIQMKCDISQGDLLSLLIFGIENISLKITFNITCYGYKIGNKTVNIFLICIISRN